MRRGARIGAFEPPDPRNIGGQFQNATIIDVIEHDRPNIAPSRPKIDLPCCGPNPKIARML